MKILTYLEHQMCCFVWNFVAENCICWVEFRMLPHHTVGHWLSLVALFWLINIVDFVRNVVQNSSIMQHAEIS